MWIFCISNAHYFLVENSGFEIKPKSLPAFFLEFLSKIGNTTFLIVPGITVLLTRMVGFFLFLEISLPTFLTTALINDKSISPFFFCGVPTVIKIKSQSFIEDSLFVIISFFFKAFFNVFF